MTYPKHLTTLPKQSGETVPLRIGGYQKLEKIERSLDSAKAELVMARGGVPVCVDGCGACCQQVPLVTRAEAELAFARVHDLGPGATRRVIQVCTDWLKNDNERLKVRGTTTTREFSDEEKRQLVEDGRHVQWKTTCPFLGKQRECTIYPIRPIPCRSYSVTNMPGPECQRPQILGETDTMKMFLAGAVEQKLARLYVDFRDWERQYHPEALAVGFLPTMLLSVFAPSTLKTLTESDDLPTCKVAIWPKVPIPWILYRSDLASRIRMAVPTQAAVAAR